jgi:hypothetical protein
MLSPWGFAAVTLFSLAMPLVSWALAGLLVGPRARRGRAAFAVGRGAVGAFVAIAALRIADLALPALDGGPQGWLNALGTPTDGWYPSDALVVLLPLLAVVDLVATLIAARQLRSAPAQDRSIPLHELPALALVVAPLVSLLFLWPVLATRSATLWGLDLLAATLLACTSLAVWTQGRDEPEASETEAEAEAEAEAAEHLDVPASWRREQAISKADTPWYRTEPTEGEADHAVVQAVWEAAGGGDAPPEALEELLTDGATPGQGRLIGDLPEPTASLVETAALVLFARELGVRVLVVGPEPQRRRDDMVAALDRLGSWPIGRLAAGTAETRESLSRREVPAVVFLTIEELSADGLGLLRDDLGGGRTLADTLGQVVLPRVDRGTPLQVTHRLFTLRRLFLALDAARARPAVLAFGFSGRGTRALVQRAFPGTDVREVPLRARSTAAVSVWLADWRFQQASGEPWARRAAGPVVAAGHAVRVTDPTGTFDADDVSIWAGDVRLDRDIDLGGSASIGILDDLWLLAAVRSLPHRVATQEPGRHHALWGLVDTPVTRFLLSKGNVHRLLERGRLQPPRPLFGHANRAIGRAHLRAALRDGDHASHALRVVFGNSLVDEIVGQQDADRWEVRLDAHGTPIRSAIVPRARADAGDPIRDTVTDRTLAVVDAQSGKVLRHVDALTAPTRFYPKRVFAHRGTRYEVPMHGLDARRSRLEVAPVPPDRPLTSPRLVTGISPREMVEAPQKISHRNLSWRLATFDLLVQERITGVRRGRDASVDYPEVTSRYRTRGRAVFFDRRASTAALNHLARSVDGVLRALLLVEVDDVDVVAVPPGWVEGWPAGIVAVDRHVQGMGVAEALDEHVIREGLELVYAILHQCDCANGCAKCTPREVLEDGKPDKGGVLALLGG